MKRFLLALIFVVSFSPCFSQSGSCGSGVKWALDGETLTISGNGEIADFDSQRPSYEIYKNNIKNIVVDHGITRIGNKSFINYTNLKSLTFSDGLVSIGVSAFEGCDQLQNFVLPISLETIEDYAFRRCNGISIFTVPLNVSSIGRGAMGGCKKLSEIIWNAKKCITDSGTPFFSDVRINGMITPNLSPIKKIIFGNSVNSIHENILAKCPTLETVETSGSIARVGVDAFSDTPWLVKKELTEFGIMYIDNALYKYNGSMTTPTTIDIPEGVKSITDEAFKDCNYLVKIAIPSTMEYIGKDAFMGCSSLGEVIWNSDLCEDFDESPFQKTSVALVSFKDGLKRIPSCLFYNCKNLLEVRLPDNLECIGNKAFYNCDGLTDIALPNSLHIIEGEAFASCDGLRKIIIPEKLQKLNYGAFQGCSNLLEVAYNAISCSVSTSSIGLVFGGCPITNFNFGDKVDTIPSCLCKGLNDISEIIIPNSVAYIGKNAFYGCTNVTDLVVGEGLKSLYEGFESCTNLDKVVWNAVCYEGRNDYNGRFFPTTIKSITFGPKVENIPANICNGCYLLSSLDLPISIKRIGSRAFSGCVGIKSLIWNIENCSDCNNSPLPNTLESIMFGESVEYIPANLCEYTSLKNIIIPASVKSIGTSAFSNCDELFSVDFSDGLVSIGDNAFSNCALSKNLIFPTSLKEIGEGAFSNNNIETLFISNNISVIKSHAFASNNKLTQVIVALNDVPKVENPFYNCNNLKKIFVPELQPFIEDDRWSDYLYILSPMVTFSPSHQVYNGKVPECSVLNNLKDYILDLENFKTSGKDVGNYSVLARANFKGENNFTVNVSYNYMITPAKLTVTPYDTVKVYGETNPDFKFRIDGFVNDEVSTDVITTFPIFTCDADNKSDVGVYEIYVKNLPKSKNYNFECGSSVLTIKPKTLNVSVKDIERFYGESNPNFDIIYEGFVNDDSSDALYVQPYAYCAADKYSPVGDYEIVLEGGLSENYIFHYLNGTLRINKANQHIVWEQDFFDIFIGDELELFAYSESGLPITFESSNPDVASVVSTGNKYILKIKGIGIVEILANQKGDSNWLPAEPFKKTIIVSDTNGMNEIEKTNAILSVTNGILNVKNIKPGVYISVYSSNGVVICDKLADSDSFSCTIDVSGVYLVNVDGKVKKILIK